MTPPVPLVPDDLNLNRHSMRPKVRHVLALIVPSFSKAWLSILRHGAMWSSREFAVDVKIITLDLAGIRGHLVCVLNFTAQVWRSTSFRPRNFAGRFRRPRSKNPAMKKKKT